MSYREKPPGREFPAGKGAKMGRGSYCVLFHMVPCLGQTRIDGPAFAEGSVDSSKLSGNFRKARSLKFGRLQKTGKNPLFRTHPSYSLRTPWAGMLGRLSSGLTIKVPEQAPSKPIEGRDEAMVVEHNNVEDNSFTAPCSSPLMAGYAGGGERSSMSQAGCRDDFH